MNNKLYPTKRQSLIMYKHELERHYKDAKNAGAPERELLLLKLRIDQAQGVLTSTKPQ